MNPFARRALVLATFAATLGAPLGAAAQKLDTDAQKTVYAIGVAISQSLAGFSLTKDELDLVKAGLNDGVLKQPKVKPEDFMQKIQAFQAERAKIASAAEVKAGTAFLDKAAKEKGAVKTPDGFVITTLKVGTGPAPGASDQVKVHYHGTLTDGSVFDSSVERGQPTTFPLNGVIACWTKGVQMMKVGGKAKLICPPGLAYGDRGAPPKIKPGATLVFEVELLEIVK